MTRRLLWATAVILAAGLVEPRAAHAQSQPPPPSGPLPADPYDTAKVRIGPFFMHPEFGLRDIGRDNNVFNTTSEIQDGANPGPQSDWTGTVRMGMLAGLRMKQLRLTMKTTTDYVYYARFKSERSIDGATRYQLELVTPRFRPWIARQGATTHGRVGLEIDSRAGREQPLHEAGVEIKWGYRLGTRLIARQRELKFKEEEEFRGADLGESLDAEWREGAVQLFYEISPLSSIRASAELSQADFAHAQSRDSEDLAVFVGLDGRRDAALEGFLDVGWRERTPDVPGAPTYSGFVARGSAAFILWESVRVAFGVDRDIPWSYDEAYTFYVEQGATTSVTWRPYQRLDLVATGRHYWLDYEKPLEGLAPARTDKVYSYGGGFGFFLRGYPGTRLGVTVERTVRESVLVDRRYDTVRYLTNVGFSF